MCFIVFTSSTREGKPFSDSPVHVVSPDQFTAAEHQHERELVVTKRDREPARDTEALRVSMDQLREVNTLNFH